MKLIAVVAMSKNRVIGKNNSLPWHLPADLQHFKQITLGKPILMGRKTFQSIGRPLPGRKNIILTGDKSFKAEGCEIVHSIEEGFKQAGNSNELMLIGGAQLFTELLPKVQKIYLTIIHKDFEGDAFFPELDKREWIEEERIDHMPDEKNPFHYSFFCLQRKF